MHEGTRPGPPAPKHWKKYEYYEKSLFPESTKDHLGDVRRIVPSAAAALRGFTARADVHPGGLDGAMTELLGRPLVDRLALAGLFSTAPSYWELSTPHRRRRLPLASQTGVARR